MRERRIFYRDRPEWADITPIPQDDEVRGVICIAYPPEFIDVHDYLRAVLASNEMSQRALDLTEDAISMNPANYTVWEYRRQIVKALGADLKSEFELIKDLACNHSKNYQIWYHRQWIATCLAEACDDQESRQRVGLGELEFTRQVIDEDDSKHYHAWQHRRWALDFFHLPIEPELAFTERLIRQDDQFNNSAWHYRYVLVSKNEGLSQAVLDRELEFVKSIIREAPQNDSSWNYAYGLANPPPSVTVDHDCRRRLMVDLKRFALDLIESKSQANLSRSLLGFLVDAYSAQLTELVKSGGDKAGGGGDDDDHESTESVDNLLSLGKETCQRLELEVDRIRASYWRYRSRQLQSIVDCSA